MFAFHMGLWWIYLRIYLWFFYLFNKTLKMPTGRYCNAYHIPWIRLHLEIFAVLYQFLVILFNFLFMNTSNKPEKVSTFGNAEFVCGGDHNCPAAWIPVVTVAALASLQFYWTSGVPVASYWKLFGGGGVGLGTFRVPREKSGEFQNFSRFGKSQGIL